MLVVLTGCVEITDTDAQADSDFLNMVRDLQVVYIGADTDHTPLRCPDLDNATGLYTCTSTVEGDEVVWAVEVEPDPGDGSPNVWIEPDFGSPTRTAEWNIRRGYREDYDAILTSVECPEISDTRNVEATCRATAENVVFDVTYQSDSSRYSYSHTEAGLGKTVEDLIANDIAKQVDAPTQADCDAPRIFQSVPGLVFHCQVTIPSKAQEVTVRFETLAGGDFDWEVVAVADASSP
ncbi:hypothetical protein [Rubrivirga sp.]|uniref:hypothetical protein n=1 Tax=Rubrivirga sp. TaxID=1885344 RepID=UPI003C7806DF